MTYYKATRMDGTDFRTGKIDYTKVPLPEMSGKGEFPGAGWLHLATTPTECIGASWPCRLFEIEPASDAIIYTDGSHPHKIGASKAYVTREIESWRFFGPQGKEIVALIERAEKLDKKDVEKLASARDSARDSAWASARASARDAWASAGLLSRDLIGKGRFTQADYDTLTIPWRSAIGPIHPDDIDIRKPNFDKEINEVQSALDNLKSAIKKGSK